MSHPPVSTAPSEARLLSDLDRDELGLRFAQAVKAARSGEGTTARGRNLAWLDDPDLAAVLDEFRRRGLELRVEVYRLHETWAALSEAAA